MIALLLLAASHLTSGCESAAPQLGTDAGPDSGVAPVFVCAERERCTEEYCEQVLVPAGEFRMGSDHPPHPDAYWPSGDERPIHAVGLDAFCIDKYEVTLDRYEDCVEQGVCSPEGLLHSGERPVLAWETVHNHYPPECAAAEDLCGDHAVNGKSYWQAKTYCAFIGSRLCTEAEWERAANGPGPEQRLHPWGDDDPTTELVNIPSTAVGPEGYVHPVDDHEAGTSAEGVFNLAGNVYEWVADAYARYDGSLDEPLENPFNPPMALDDPGVARGSCFFTEPEHTVSERSVFYMDFDWG